MMRSLKNKNNLDSAIYDKKWETQWGPARKCYGPSFYHKKRLIQKIFKKYSLKGDIIEVGCGDGSLLSQFCESSNNLYGYDISEKAIELAKSKFGDTAFFSVGDITKPDLLFEKKFDVVLCSEVLEHIENDRLAIKHLYNLLKPDGCVIITVPHLKKYWSHLDISDNHKRRYEKDALENILNVLGFAVYENFDWGYPLFHMYYERILKREKKNIMGDVSRKPVLKYFLSKILILLVYFDDLFLNSGKGRTIFMLCKKEKNKTNVSGELMGDRKYIAVSPAKNEEKNLPRLIQSVAEQTIKPRVWVIVDDGSKDGTPNIIRGAQEEHSWIQSVRLKEHPRDLGKRYAYVCNTGFNHAVKYCEAHDIPYEYVGLVDADMTLETELFEKLITEFERNPRLGVVSSTVYNCINNKLILENVRDDILVGSPKLWRKKCFEETGGGYLLTYSADAVSIVLAKLRGWEARRFEKINAIQARKTSSAEGLWKGYVTNGISAYFLNSNTLYVLIKGLKYTFEKPHYIGIAYLYGYFSSALRRMDKIDNEEVRDYFYRHKPKEAMIYYKNKIRNKLISKFKEN